MWTQCVPLLCPVASSSPVHTPVASGEVAPTEEGEGLAGQPPKGVAAPQVPAQGEERPTSEQSRQLLAEFVITLAARCVCVCVCACVRPCMCVCVCVCSVLHSRGTPPPIAPPTHPHTLLRLHGMRDYAKPLSAELKRGSVAAAAGSSEDMSKLL